MTIRLETMPLTTNRLYGFANGRRYLRPEGKRNKDAMAWDARSQFRGAPLTGRLAVEVDLFWPTRRNHDIENLKALFDALSGIVWEDDGQIVDLHIRKHVNTADPHVILSVAAANS